MDSFPNSNFKIKEDIMTPHHSEYYNGTKKAPLDSKEKLFQINIIIDKGISNEKWKKDNEETIEGFM